VAMTLQEAQAKWARNAQAGAASWHGDEADFCQGLAKFGLSPAQCQAGIGQRYAQGIAQVSPQQFAQAISQAAQTDKWARRWLAGISK